LQGAERALLIKILEGSIYWDPCSDLLQSTTSAAKTKDRLRGLLWLVIMVVVVLYGIYLGIWLLQKEERNNSMQFKNAGIENRSRF
jgi:hypothetical protein